MALLSSLFRRPVRRHYVLIDDSRCRTLLTATELPHGDHWVPGVSLGMLGSPLPHPAR